MLRKLKNSLMLLIAVVAMGQDSMISPAVRRVGEKLACLCGACKNTVGTCDMMGCHYTAPKREQIAGLLAKGVSDDAIIDTIVKEVGLKALSEPPRSGFNAMALLMPFVMIGIGLSAIYWFIQNSRKLRPVDSTAPVISERYQAMAEKEIEKLN